MKPGANQVPATQKASDSKPFWDRWERKPGYVLKRHRMLFPSHPVDLLLDRALSAIWPWQASEYPGRIRLLAWLLGDVPVRTAQHYRKIAFPKFRALIVAENLQRKADGILEVIAELRAYAESGQSQSKVNGSKTPIVSPPSD